MADRYRVERLLGEGGMGAVWEATHTRTRKAFALKFLKASAAAKPQMRQRFLREARTACAVQHPSIIQVHDVLELPDATPVIVMELLRGETLAARLLRDRTIPVPELARIMLPVCSAVGTAHHVGIVHRDLKPENIFLATSRDDDAVHVKVLDFGVAKLTALDGDAARSAGATATGTGMLLGTPYYMSPEQVFGEKDLDHRADIWALGVILYEALAGARPTAGDNVGQIFKIVMTDAIIPLTQRVPSLPEPMTSLVARMLAHDRAKRPADLREVCAVLETYCDDAAQSFGPPGPPSDIPVEPFASERDASRSMQGAPAWRPTKSLLWASSAGVAGVLGALVWRFAPLAPRGSPPHDAASSEPAVEVPVAVHPPEPDAAIANVGVATATVLPPESPAAGTTPRESSTPRSSTPTDGGARRRAPLSQPSSSTPLPPAPPKTVDPGSYL